MTSPDQPELDLDRIERTAREATPGPWHHERFFRSGDTPDTVPRYRIFLLGASNPRTNSRDCDWTQEDAAHIATMDPDTTLAILARLRAADARVAELETTNERLLSSDPSEVCAAWRDGFTSGVLGEKPPHGTMHVTRLGRIAELEAGIRSVMDGWATWSIGYDGAMNELRKLVNP